MRRATVFPSRAHRLAFALWLAVTLPASGAQAVVVVNQPWVKPAVAGASTEAYMNLTATEGATLVAVRSDNAAGVTLHRPGNVTRTTDELALPPRTMVELAPGKYRISLRRLSNAVKLGDIVPLTLTIKDADGAEHDIAVSAVGRLRSPVDDERRAHKRRH